MYRSDILIMVLIGFLSICTLGFGIYAAYEYSQRNVYENNAYTCGNFNNITKLVITKDIWSIWHWTYRSDNSNFVQRCPTFDHDASIYNNDRLVARTNGKIATTISELQIKDCHGNVKYTIESGDLFQTIINANKIWVSLIVKDVNGIVFTYISSTIFIAGTVTFNDIYGNSIATIIKDITTDGWKWSYDIFNQSTIGMEVLIAITAKLSFYPGPNEKKDKNDMCNQFFLGAGITSLILIGILIIIGLVLICKKFND